MHKDAQKVNFYGDGCNSDLIGKVDKVHGAAASNQPVINVSFSSGNGCFSFILSSARFIAFISTNLMSITDSLSSEAISQETIISDENVTINNVQAIKADVEGRYRIKITTSRYLSAFDIIFLAQDVRDVNIGYATS